MAALELGPARHDELVAIALLLTLASSTGGRSQSTTPKRGSPSTHNEFGPALAKLDAWLEGRALDDTLLADYLGHLVDNGHSRNTAMKTVAAARRRAKFTGTKGPAGPRTRAALSRIGVRGERAPGVIEWKDLASAVPRIEGESLTGCRDAAIIALGCAVDLSAAEMTALDADDLFRGEDGQWRIRIRGSGSDNTGEARALDDATVCKVRTWLGKKNITCGPMFPRMTKHRGAHKRMAEFGIRIIVTRRSRDARLFISSANALAMGLRRAQQG